MKKDTQAPALPEATTRRSLQTAKSTPEKAPSKQSILLRSVPPEVLAAISAKKVEIMTRNPHRTTISDSEAVFKLILKRSEAA